MKYLRLFENAIMSAQSMKNIIDEYDNFMTYISPFVMKKYEELAQEEDYEPERGDAPDPNDSPQLISAYTLGIGFGFHLQGFNNDGEVSASYYIEFKDGELEEWIKNCEIRDVSKKYNI